MILIQGLCVFFGIGKLTSEIFFGLDDEPRGRQREISES